VASQKLPQQQYYMLNSTKYSMPITMFIHNISWISLFNFRCQFHSRCILKKIVAVIENHFPVDFHVLSLNLAHAFHKTKTFPKNQCSMQLRVIFGLVRYRWGYYYGRGCVCGRRSEFWVWQWWVCRQKWEKFAFY